MKIKAHKEPWSGRIGFLIYNDTGNVLSVVKPVDLVATTIPEGGPTEPTFSVAEPFAYEFIQSMAELAEEMGIKTKKQQEQEQRAGVILDATKYHLEDMRALVFKKSRK